MKLNWNTVATILTLVNDNIQGENVDTIIQWAQNTTPDQRVHVFLLHDGGFITSTTLTTALLTWKGLELLNKLSSGDMLIRVQTIAKSLSIPLTEALINKVYDDFLECQIKDFKGIK